MIECPGANHDNVVAAAADLESHPSVHVDDEFPLTNLCPFLINKPPVSGAYFDVRGSDGQLSSQLFEYSRLYRYKSTMGSGRALRSVRHPMTGGWIKRVQATTLIRRVSPELQGQLDVERRQRGLPTEDELPLLEQDYLNNNSMMRRVLNPYVFLIL